MDATQAAALAVGGLVAAVWAIALVHGVLSGDYMGAEIATPVMLFVAGYLFGIHNIKKAIEH